MLSASDVRVLDLNSAWHGVPPSILMRNAGRAVADVARKRYEPGNVLVLAGLSNNGGDGAVVANEMAQAGASVTLLYAGDPSGIKTGEARLAHATLDARRIRVESYRGPERLRELLTDADLVVDALLGVGVRGELREPIRTIVRTANGSRRRVLAVDVPTGLGGRLQIRPDATVTLHARKRGMTRANSGSILVRDIGIPAAAQDEVGPGDLAVHYPRNAPDSHKGQNGRLLVIAGGPYCGAPLLAATSALRTGCDLVRLYTPAGCASAASGHAPDLIVHAGAHEQRLVPQDVPRMSDLWRRVDAVLLGPGLGLHRDTRAAVESILAETQRRRLPLVLDADAHAVAGQHADLLRRRPALCTPHPREYRDLTRHALPRSAHAHPRAVEAAARRLGATILLKAPIAVISDGHRVRRSRAHPPGFTVGGIGDALSGACAGLAAKGLEAWRAAAAGSFLVGEAARRAVAELSAGARATDVIDRMPRVLRDWIGVTPTA